MGKSNTEKISLGRPDETAIRRVAIGIFAAIALGALASIPFVPSAASSDVMATGLTWLLGGFGALFALMSAVLWWNRPPAAIAEPGRHRLTIGDETVIPTGDIEGIDISLVEQWQGRVRYGRWEARATVGGRDEPLLVARAIELPDIYPALRQLAQAIDIELQIKGSTPVADELFPDEGDADSADVESSESSQTYTWTYLHGIALIFGVSLIVAFAVVYDPERPVAVGNLIGSFAIAGFLGLLLHLLVREYSLPFAQGRHRVEKTGRRITYSRLLSSKQWCVDDVEHIVRRDDFRHGVMVLGDDVAVSLPSNSHDIDNLHDRLLAMHLHS